VIAFRLVRATDEFPAPSGFGSDTPNEDRQRLCDWLTERDQECELGEWSESELWLGVPGLFFDFVIEIFDNRLLSDIDYPAAGSTGTN
jgi:hypothetical protein